MKHIKVVTTFSGIGMQERGIEEVDSIEAEIIATSEINADAIISYAAIHKNLAKELSTYLFPTKEEMCRYLCDLNINYDFKKQRPYNWDRASLEKIKKTYLASILSKNMGDIAKIKQFPKCDILTFSFPCTDISAAGRQTGLSNTRSGLVYEVVRILKSTEEKPKFLLMENVTNLVRKTFIQNYEALNEEFLKIGYKVTYGVLDAKDFGVPQSRKRVFAIYYLETIDMTGFDFPKKIPSTKCLNDILQSDVDEKYYINSEKAKKEIERIDSIKDIEKRDLDNATQIGSLQAPAPGGKWKNPSASRVYSRYSLSPTLVTSTGGNHQPFIYFRGNPSYIRKLTPEESFILMGMTADDCHKCKEVGISDYQLYNQSGNGLVTPCITALIKELYTCI